MNNDTARISVLAALRKANAVIGIGDVHGWPRPQSYTDALAMLNAAREADRDVPTAPPAPVKPKDIPKWITTTVDIRQREHVRHDIVDTLLLTWERNLADAGLTAIPDFCSRLVTHFDELLDKFDALNEAPRTITGHESPEQLEAHTAALRVAGELYSALLHRATIADAAHEAEDIGPDIIWLILAPQPSSTRDQINNALKTFQSRVPQSLAEWDTLRPLGLRLARLGEVAARRERHTNFMFNASMRTPDLGMKDHSYGEIEGTKPGPNLGQAFQAETDATFEHSPSISI